jgi:hypothetical protein
LQAGGRRFDPDRLHTAGQPSVVSGRRFRSKDDDRDRMMVPSIADVRIRFDHGPGQSVLGGVVMPFVRSPITSVGGGRVVLCQGESGSGASLGACIGGLWVCLTCAVF